MMDPRVFLCQSGCDLAQVEGQETRKSPDLIKRAAIGGMPGNQMALFALSWPAAAAVGPPSTPSLDFLWIFSKPDRIVMFAWTGCPSVTENLPLNAVAGHVLCLSTYNHMAMSQRHALVRHLSIRAQMSPGRFSLTMVCSFVLQAAGEWNAAAA